jgi:hypothetical protein
MRNLVLRLAAIAGVVLTLGACADSPTQADQQRAPDLAAPAQDEQVTPQGCVIDGLCTLPPISGGWCDPYEELDWSCDDDPCMTSVGDPTDPEEAVSVHGCPGGGGGGALPGGGTQPPPGSGPGTTPVDSTALPCELDCPAEEETADTDICPQPVSGRTLTYLATIAGRNHEFKFRGVMRRVNPAIGRSPAWYEISGPHVSRDSWWIAQSGNIQLVCWGRWSFRNSFWIGTIIVQSDDLHFVMGPGHPDFENQPPYPPTSPAAAL